MPHKLLVGILLAAFLLQSLFSSLQKSPVYDEPPHIASGLSYLATGVFRANMQHPPLLKEIAGLFLLAAGVRWPHTDEARAVLRGVSQGEPAEWPVGNSIIATNGPDRVLFWARLPFILLAGLLGLLIYVWGRELVGPAAVLGALFLFALDPTIVAHSFLVTTDVGLATFSVLFMWTVWRYIQSPSLKSAAICGLAMGAMLGSKFSALFMAASAAVLLLVAALQTPRAARIAPNSQCPCGSGKKYKRCHGAPGAADSGAKRFSPMLGFLLMCGVALLVVEALYFFPHDPFLYLAGLQKVNADHSAGYPGYFHGQISTRFYTYFVAAYLLKEPLATILAVGAGLFVLLRNKSAPLLTKLFLLLPPAVFLVAMTVFADDMGVRYLIPAMPFAYLLGGIGLAALFASARKWGRYAAIALCVWLIVAAAGIYPDHLSYFNETACLLTKPTQIGWDGGSRCGPLWLDDSNVDWGQGLKQLRTWQDRHPNLPPLRLSYPDTFPPDSYGLRLDPSYPIHQLLTNPTPGWYAISAHLVARVPTIDKNGGGTWLARIPPAEIVGHAYYIYNIP